ncbi:hypothetical protein D3C74_484970 [compost metagenome]
MGAVLDADQFVFNVMQQREIIVHDFVEHLIEHVVRIPLFRILLRNQTLADVLHLF